MTSRSHLNKARRAGSAQRSSYSTDELLVKTAGQFNVYRHSDYPEVNLVIDSLFDQIKYHRALRKERIRGANNVKKHLKVVVIDLWAGYRLGLNPYHGISKNKSDYQKGDRYRKLFLKYDYLIPIIDDLSELGYVEQIIGSWTDGIRTRIKATPQLIDLVLNPQFGVDKLINSRGDIGIVQNNPDQCEELIRLKGTKDAQTGEAPLIDYEDSEYTIRMRNNVESINKKIIASQVTLRITDTQFARLIEQIKRNKDPRKLSLDFTNNQLYRVFNNASFQHGGRFYGGWWQSVPREFRKYIQINHKPTVELDYSGHHFRIMYASNDLEAPDDPYDLEGFDRDLQKEAAFIIINSSSSREAAVAIRNKVGITNSALFVKLFSERHQAICRHFFTGAGLPLMYQDSMLAEAVMLEMLKRGATVLPVHDSFIVRNSFDNELEEVMKAEFGRLFGQTAKLAFKKTVLEEDAEERVQRGDTSAFAVDDLEVLYDNQISQYSKYHQIWGI